MKHQLVMTSNQLGNLVQMTNWETKKIRNPWKQKFPVSDGIQRIQRAERHKNVKIQDMLSTCVGVLLVSKVEVLVDNIELNYWKKQKVKKNNSDRSFRLRFSDTGKRRHVSNSDLSRQQVWSNGSDML